MEVPFVDLNLLFKEIGEECLTAVRGVAASSDFILGKDVAAFEAEFAAYCGVKHAIGLDSGVSALELALRACGVGPGDEVITVSHSFIATASAVSFEMSPSVLPSASWLAANRVAAPADVSTPLEAGTLLEKLSPVRRQAEITRRRYPWASPWWLAAALALFLCEWAWRRWRGYP